MKNRTFKIFCLFLVSVMLISAIVGCTEQEVETAEQSDTGETVTVTESETTPDTETVTDDTTDIPDETGSETETETEPSNTDEVSADETETETEPVTETETEPVTETETEGTTAVVTKEPVTTAEESTTKENPPVQQQQTAAPVVLNTASLNNDRVLIYGSAEPNSVIRTTANGTEMKNKCNDKYFYIEIGMSKTTEVTLYATAAGKTESKATKISVTPSPAENKVWGGKDSRLYFIDTLAYLTGNRADSGSLDTISNMITKKTIVDIQKATGKETKLIFAIIPDPATAYYDEHFKYVQDAVADPSTSAMESFNKKLTGLHKDVYAIDLLPVMRAHKNESIYFSTDTHYTELGAYYTYLEIMKTVAKDNSGVKVRKVENGDYTIEYKDVSGGDLCGMIGMNMNEVVPFFVAKFSDTGSYYKSKRNDGMKSAGFNPSGWQRDSSLTNSNNPTAYFIADSYGCYILPFIGANFSKVWTNEGVLWNFDLDQSILEQNKPDYVIVLVCQRNLISNFMSTDNRIQKVASSVMSFQWDD